MVTPRKASPRVTPPADQPPDLSHPPAGDHVKAATSSSEVQGLSLAVDIALPPELDQSLAVSQLPYRKQLFAIEYCKDLNGVEAVLRCGFTTDRHSASVIASRLLGELEVQRAIDGRLLELAAAAGITQEWVLGELRAIAVLGRSLMVQDPRQGMNANLALKTLGIFTGMGRTPRPGIEIKDSQVVIMDSEGAGTLRRMETGR